MCIISTVAIMVFGCKCEWVRERLQGKEQYDTKTLIETITKVIIVPFLWMTLDWKFETCKQNIRYT